MNIKKGGMPVVSLTPQGDIRFAAFYEEENVPQPVPAAALRIVSPAGTALASRDLGPLTDIALSGRFSAKAVFPQGARLCIKEPGGNVVAVLTDTGDLLVGGQDLTVTPNPAGGGPFRFDAVVYAVDGLDYPPARKGEYGVFEHPTSADYQTRSLDLSSVIRSGVGNPTYWPFTITDVPINGMARIPRGTGPFPLVVFAHGNHVASDNSTPGYIYLCELLASHGMIAATIDVNFLNQTNGENAARALVHLEHVRQFQMWNVQAGHPLENKVDLDRVAIAGHSRGGEAAAHASLFYGLDNLVPFLPVGGPPPPPPVVVPLDGTGEFGPYNFQLRGVIAIAPTDDQYKPVTPNLPYAQYSTIVNDTNYFLIHGALDADVVNFQGYRTYDRALPYDRADMLQPASGIKSLLWVYGANHNYFNTAWGWDGGQNPGNRAPPDLMLPDLQRDIARVYLGAWAQIHLLGRSSYWPLFRDPKTPGDRGWLPVGLTLVSQYHDKQRLWLQDFDNTGLIDVTAPVTGNVDATHCTARQLLLDNGRSRYLYEETGGLRVQWANVNEYYVVSGLDFHGDVSRFQVLSLRVGQSPEPTNARGAVQDFTIRIGGNGAQFDVRASTLADLPYPSAPSNPPYTAPYTGPYTIDRKMVMQTIRVPLSRIAAAGISPAQISSVSFRFDRTNQGVLYFDDLQLSL